MVGLSPPPSTTTTIITNPPPTTTTTTTAPPRNYLGHMRLSMECGQVEGGLSIYILGINGHPCCH